MNSTSVARSIAIIGGGQLGYLLCEAARQLGITTAVITPDHDAPALAVADHAIVSALDVPGLGRKIADVADAATFEIESVPDVLLNELDAEQKAGNLLVRPAPAVMRLLKNKAVQKRWLVEQGFPTLPYYVSDNPAEEKAEILARFPLPFVQKAQQGGYDGYGVQVIGSSQETDHLWPVPSTIEQFLVGVRELAVLSARSADGAITTYDPAGLEFDAEKNILNAVIAPADISADLSAEAVRLATDVVERLQGVGIFAIEMFVTADDELLINEVSPRVHNSGHHTLESCVTSQFEQHVRAVAGMPHGSVAQTKAAVMKNILFTNDIAHLCARGPGIVPTRQDSVAVYWYGKHTGRPGRKMGHITCVGPDRATAERHISVSLAELVSTRNEEMK